MQKEKRKRTKFYFREGKIRFYIDGEWSASEMTIFFSSLSSLYRFYNSYCLLDDLNKEEKLSKVKFISKRHRPLHFQKANINRIVAEDLFPTQNEPGYYRYRNHSEDIQISKIQFASPGFTDLIGLGRIVKQIKDILFHYIPNKTVNERNKILEQKRFQMQIQNLKEIGFSDIDIQKMVLNEKIAIENIKILMEDKKIISVEDDIEIDFKE